MQQLQTPRQPTCLQGLASRGQGREDGGVSGAVGYGGRRQDVLSTEEDTEPSPEGSGDSVRAEPQRRRTGLQEGCPGRDEGWLQGAWSPECGVDGQRGCTWTAGEVQAVSRLAKIGPSGGLIQSFSLGGGPCVQRPGSGFSLRTSISRTGTGENWDRGPCLHPPRSALGASAEIMYEKRLGNGLARRGTPQNRPAAL